MNMIHADKCIFSSMHSPITLHHDLNLSWEKEKKCSAVQYNFF